MDEGPSAERRTLRRAVSRLVAGGALVAATATLLYFVAPLPGGGRTAWWLVVGIVGVAALMAFQTVAISRSPYPRAQAIGALVTSVPLLVLLFATAHLVLSLNDAGSHTEPLSRIDSVYFSVTTFATVGFGDIAPASQAARAVTTVQVVVNVVVVAVIAHVVLEAVRIGLRRRSTPDDTP